jgi:hypothetical protein
MVVTVGSKNFIVDSKMRAANILQVAEGMRSIKELWKKSSSISKLVFMDLKAASISTLALRG